MELAIVAARTVREFSLVIAASLGGVFHTGRSTSQIVAG
jgi:hypothetical protein